MDHFSSFPAIPRLAVAAFTAVYTVPTPTTLRNSVPSKTFINQRMKRLLRTCFVVELTGFQTAREKKGVRDKCKVHYTTRYEGTDGGYSYTLSLPSTLDGSGWLTPRPDRFTSWNDKRLAPRPIAGLDGWRKSHLHRDSIPGPSSPQRVAIPTTLSRPIRGRDKDKVHPRTGHEGPEGSNV
jgi:hypothetical protein